MVRQIKDILLLVSVVFRHGDRPPLPWEMNFLSGDVPVGIGDLTYGGKQRMFNLGTELRKRYSNFLDDTYIPEQVGARSTDTNRTRLSLDLLLTGLYAPPYIHRWSPELKSPQIPILSVPRANDPLLSPHEATPQYIDEIERVGKLPEAIKKSAELCPLVKNISTFLTKPVRNIRDLWILFEAFKAVEALNHTLPEWTSKVYPNGALGNAAVQLYKFANYNNWLKKLNGGMLIRRVIEDMKAAASKSTHGINIRKVNLFSGHENNIAGVLTALGLYKPHVPEFSSAVIIELIKRGEVYYVKVVRYLGIPAEFEVQQIPGCATLCPLDRFIYLMQKVTPSDEEIQETQKFPKYDFRTTYKKVGWGNCEATKIRKNY